MPVHGVAALPRSQAELVEEGQHDWTNVEFLLPGRKEQAVVSICEVEAVRVALGRRAENSGQGEGQWEGGPLSGFRSPGY